LRNHVWLTFYYDLSNTLLTGEKHIKQYQDLRSIEARIIHFGEIDLLIYFKHLYAGVFKQLSALVLDRIADLLEWVNCINFFAFLCILT